MMLLVARLLSVVGVLLPIPPGMAVTMPEMAVAVPVDPCLSLCVCVCVRVRFGRGPAMRQGDGDDGCDRERCGGTRDSID